VFPGKTEAETLESLACREAIALARGHKRATSPHREPLPWSYQEPTLGAYAHIIQEITESQDDFDELIFIHERRVPTAK
jgi:hypothetical protein